MVWINTYKTYNIYYTERAKNIMNAMNIFHKYGQYWIILDFNEMGRRENIPINK